MLQDVRLLRIHNFLRRSFDHAIGSAMLLHPLCSTLHSGTWSAGSDGESIIIHFSLTSSRSFAIIQSNQKSPLFPRFFWISHERCISSVWFSTVQTVVLRLKVFWCELSTTRIGISSESSANDLKQQVLVTSELWKASSYGTETTFLQMVLGQLGQVACRNHDKFHVRQQWRCSWNQRGRTSWRWWSHVQKVIRSQVNVCFETVNWECPPGASYFSSCYPLLLEKNNKR